MEPEDIADLKQVVRVHAEVVAATAEIQKMKLANDDARSEGGDDIYNSDDFGRVEQSLRDHANALAE